MRTHSIRPRPGDLQLDLGGRSRGPNTAAPSGLRWKQGHRSGAVVRDVPGGEVLSARRDGSANVRSEIGRRPPMSSYSTGRRAMLSDNPASNVSYSERDLKSPLGERNRWGKPTVLLGSAGHLLAAPWSVFGGSG